MNNPLGKINILINGQSINLKPTELSNKGKNFIVDKRFQIAINLVQFNNKDVFLDCVVESDHIEELKSETETGEKLALMSFYRNNTKLSIGFEGDIPNVNYEYLRDRIRIYIPQQFPLKEIKCNVAWLTTQHAESEDLSTWFAADPSIS